MRFLTVVCCCCCVTGIRLRLHRVQPIIYKSIRVLSIHDAWHQFVIHSVTTAADLPAHLPAHHRELIHGRRRRGRRRRVNAVTTPQDRKRQQQELVADAELTCRRQVRRRCVLCTSHTFVPSSSAQEPPGAAADCARILVVPTDSRRVLNVAQKV